MNYSINDIQKITGGEIQGAESRVVLKHIFFDTRKIAIARQGLFICFSGFKRDGHDFIQSAIDKGISHFIVEKLPEVALLKTAQFLLVDSSLAALQQLATHHRKRFDIPIIGITGSNGKTIVKEWLYTILSEVMTVVKSPMSYNSQIGVALSLLQINDSHDAAIIEAAVADVGDMKSLSEMIDCTHGIFTNIGDAHQAGFESLDQKVEEKALLFQHADTVIFSSDHQEIKHRLSTFSFETDSSWSTQNSPSSFKITIDSATGRRTIHIDNSYAFYTKLQEPYALENLNHCIIASLKFGLTTEQIQSGINKLQKLSLRLELKEGSYQNTIIDDSYSFDLISFESALASLRNHANQKEKVVIQSDIPHSHDNENVYQTIAALLHSHGVSQVYHVGQDANRLRKELDPSIQLHRFADTNSLLESIQQSPIKHSAILVKGARVFHFETIVKALTKQRQQTELEVNLSALRHNLNVFSKHLKPATKILSIIKANAYGTGSVVLARFLESIGIDYLAVAYTDEGIELREQGINLPILVLNPELHHFDDLHRYRLEPEIYSLEQLLQLCEYTAIKSELPIHLKFDTGMNRLGFHLDELEQVTAIITEHKLQVKAIMSHLAAADDPSKDERTHAQIASFKLLVESLNSQLENIPICHILNSSGIIRFPEAQYDMVRIGKGMYGIDMTDEFDDTLERVHRLTATISQIKEVPKGSTIGYGCHTILDRDHRIAIINIGYADGLVRSLGNGQISFKVRQKMVPTIGNICMDMCMLDITGQDGIELGDRVEIFGEQVDIRKVAAAGGTIPLEILSKLSRRLKKVYSED